MSRRFFRHGELPLVLLALVAQRPRHGYEIMSELTRLFGPRYRASPGSVYPAIDALQSEQLIAGSEERGRTVYRITEAGAQALEDRAEMLASLEYRHGVSLASGDSLEALLDRFKARLAPLGNRVDLIAAEDILERAADELEQASTRRPVKSHDRSNHA
jgi:DNA-binding PadR family transcriptional regulator